MLAAAGYIGVCTHTEPKLFHIVPYLHYLPVFTTCPLFRPQAKALGEHLVVGLIPDSEIRRCKGPPVMSDEERHIMVESVKWVDEVITGAFTFLQHR